MRTTMLTTAGAALAALALTTLSLPAAAAPPATYDGEFAGSVAYEGCTTPAPDATTTGTWSVTLHGTSAKAVFDIWVNGEPHVAYTFPGMKSDQVEPPTVFSVHGTTGAGPLTVTLVRRHLSYTIAPYSYDGLTCESVTYPGHR
jgi:hypothetical protein